MTPDLMVNGDKYPQAFREKTDKPSKSRKTPLPAIITGLWERQKVVIREITSCFHLLGKERMQLCLGRGSPRRKTWAVFPQQKQPC